ncbi:hypothetical protein [Acinetobacter variabilis]|uniref:hypothetical protein n=1 Tax=Acinetobacter variabilis TaxID=70346 RepID=UPI00289B65C2|nr:hypothetical protein [Acinetobacter variabilis]
MKLKLIIPTICVASLAGCNSIQQMKSDMQHPYVSPQELIVKRNLNQADGSAKEYVYSWEKSKQHLEPQSLYPRTTLSQYCHERGGKFSLLYKSQLASVKDSAQKNRLSKNRYVTQGIGAYQCTMPQGQNWIVSIEPISEHQPDKNNTTRVVRILSKLQSPAEARHFYQGHKTTTKSNKIAEKNAAKTSVKDEKKELDKKEADKKEIKIPAIEPAVIAVPAARTTSIETPQQQQMKLYVAARRDINSGKNLNNACNNAQRAYNYGKLQGTEGTRVYTESGMLVARCLSSIPVYANRIPNSKVQAKRVLQNLATNYNHTGAKNQLRQLK